MEDLILSSVAPSCLPGRVHGGRLVALVGALLAAAPTIALAASPSPAATPVPLPACESTLQSLVEDASAGSTISVDACTFTETVRIDKPITIVGPAVIDGQDRREFGIVVEADDVTIDGLTITRTTNAPQTGGVQVRDSDRFTLRNATITEAAGACISIAGGSGHLVVDSELASCEQEGFHMTATADSTFRGNKIHDNNPNLAYDPYWEAGAGKATRVSNLVFDGNEVYDNRGPGLWCDIDCRDVEFVGNRVHHNDQNGIFFEISTGADIHDNVVWENGWSRMSWGWGAGILVSSSGGADVHDNIVAWNADGISVISQGREDRDPATDNRVRDNTIVVAPRAGDSSDKFMLGWLEDWSGPLYGSDSGNAGTGNRYWDSRPEPTTRFAWQNGKQTLADFNATPGDEGGSYLTTDEKDAMLSSVGLPIEPETSAVQDRPTNRELAGMAAAGGATALLVLVGLVVLVRSRRSRPTPAAPEA